jgi:hypothetical protein
VITITSNRTFSKITGNHARSTQNSGIPVYIIGWRTYSKKYGDQLGATDGLLGRPGRMTFWADNTLPFAKRVARFPYA